MWNALRRLLHIKTVAQKGHLAYLPIFWWEPWRWKCSSSFRLTLNRACQEKPRLDSNSEYPLPKANLRGTHCRLRRVQDDIQQGTLCPRTKRRVRERSECDDKRISWHSTRFSKSLTHTFREEAKQVQGILYIGCHCKQMVHLQLDFHSWSNWASPRKNSHWHDERPKPLGVARSLRQSGYSRKRIRCNGLWICLRQSDLGK